MRAAPLSFREAVDCVALCRLCQVADASFTERLLSDETFLREFALLRDAEQRCRNRASDIRGHMDFAITHPYLLEWQACSDEIVKTQPGRSDLRRHRRMGILRILDGDDKGMPFDLPPIVALPPSPWRNAVWRTFRLIDELEYLEMIYVPCDHPLVRMRPVVDLLSHRQARAILGWRASTLDYWISIPDFIGGLRKIDIPPAARATLDALAAQMGKTIREPRWTVHRLAFEALPFMIWLMSNQN